MMSLKEISSSRMVLKDCFDIRIGPICILNAVINAFLRLVLDSYFHSTAYLKRQFLSGKRLQSSFLCLNRNC